MDLARSRFHGLLVSGEQSTSTTGGLLRTMCSDLEIVGNRLFGPPPQNATYLAVYEINLGQLSGSASTDLVNSIAVSVATGFKNPLDSLAEEYCLVFEPDVTVVKFSVNFADLTWSIPQAAILSGVRVDSNDLGRKKTYKHIKSVIVPSVKLQCLAQMPNDAGLLNEWFEIASASFDISADIYGAPPDWNVHMQCQRTFVQSQDMLTSQAPWIYDSRTLQVPGLLLHERYHVLLVLTPVSRVPERPFPFTACSCDVEISAKCC